MLVGHTGHGRTGVEGEKRNQVKELINSRGVTCIDVIFRERGTTTTADQEAAVELRVVVSDELKEWREGERTIYYEEGRNPRKLWPEYNARAMNWLMMEGDLTNWMGGMHEMDKAK